ncbi:MAG: ABC transporter ATP-binding protein [Thermoleophilia bacterium]|nr:ABC transporter ATP-binding protein [Thermoleophilia bacterium]
MPDVPVELDGVVKTFGDVRALDGVSLTVPPGSIYGFLGPNGSGKTTTLRLLTGLARPTSGRVRVLGRRPFPAPPTLLARIGYLPDVPHFYEWMTGDEFLRFSGTLFGLERRVLDERVDALLELSGLRGVAGKIGGYSRGMKQRLGVAQALVNAPDLLLLDEPTSALDPLGRKEILDMIAGMRGRATVFFSTHILADVERTCDTIAILDRGRVVAEAPIDELRRRTGRHRLLVGVDDPARLAAAVRGREWSTEVEVAGPLVRVTVSDLTVAQRELPALIAGLGLALTRLDADEVSLEEVFVDLVGGRS